MNLEKRNAILPSSTFVDAKNSLHKKEEIYFFVEAYSDVDFWYTLLKDANLSFEYKISACTRGGKCHEQGKRTLEKLFDNTGKNLIICLDSDYDYLIDCKTDIARQINKNKFIFQTYCYSIENMFCYPENLTTALVSSTCSTDKPIDFENLLKSYSKAIYHLFLWHIYSYKIDESFLKNCEFKNDISIECNPIINNNFSTKECNQLNALIDKVKNKLETIQSNYGKYNEDVNNFSNQLKDKGLTEDNCYLFVNGHTLYSNIAGRYFYEARKFCIKNIEDGIKKSDKPVAIDQNINQLRNQTIKNDIAIKYSKDFKDCFCYKKIQDDLKRLIA